MIFWKLCAFQKRKNVGHFRLFLYHNFRLNEKFQFLRILEFIWSIFLITSKVCSDFVSYDDCIGKISSRSIKSNPNFSHPLWRNCSITAKFTQFFQTSCCGFIFVASDVNIRGPSRGPSKPLYVYCLSFPKFLNWYYN